MNFGTKGINTDEKKFSESKWITMGNQELKIYDIEIKKATSGSRQLILHVEGRPVNTEGFTPEDGHKGKVGKIAFPGVYVKMEDKSIEEFSKNIALLADKLGVRDLLDKITVPESTDMEAVFDEYVTKITPLMLGKWAWWSIAGEQYWKTDPKNPADFKSGTRLKIRRYGFIASTAEGATHLKPFDLDDQYCFKKTPKPVQVDNNIPF